MATKLELVEVLVEEHVVGVEEDAFEPGSHMIFNIVSHFNIDIVLTRFNQKKCKLSKIFTEKDLIIYLIFHFIHFNVRVFVS